MSGAVDISGRVSAALADGPVAAVNGALDGSTATWLVGGSVRDVLLGRPVTDIDLAVNGDARAVARAIHERLHGDIFSMSERFGTWRVSPQGTDLQIDITALRGETIEQDLAMRDFTINAMAVSLGPGTRESSNPIDLFGGLEDLAGSTLRVLGESAYTDDPLRPLRLPRFAATLGFAPDAETARLTKLHAAGITEAAAERQFAELRALVLSDGVLRGLSLLEELGLLPALVPELIELHGVEQSVYHHLDAFDHTIEVLVRLIELVDDPGQVFAADADRLKALLDQPLADEMTRGQALRFVALLHDIAKSRTRTVFDNGHVGFPDHDRQGAELARTICRRFNVSDRFTQFVSAITRHHLDLGFLVHQRPLPPRTIYRYLRSCEPVEVEVGVLSVADRTATRGRKADESIDSHLELARELNRAALDWRASGKAEPLVRGDLLARELGIDPGPQLGRLLEAIAEARYAGELSTADEAIAFARSGGGL
ncbi:MAG: HD domain-containing protein [Solirubrobacterales bacterium]